MVARCGSSEDAGLSFNGSIPPPTGDHKGPPGVHPATLAPTESWVGAQVDAHWDVKAGSRLSTLSRRQRRRKKEKTRIVMGEFKGKGRI